MNNAEKGIPALAATKQVAHALGIGRTTLWAWVKSGKFPKPIKLGNHRIAWLWSDVHSWLEARMRERDEVAA